MSKHKECLSVEKPSVKLEDQTKKPETANHNKAKQRESAKRAPEAWNLRRKLNAVDLNLESVLHTARMQFGNQRHAHADLGRSTSVEVNGPGIAKSKRTPHPDKVSGA